MNSPLVKPKALVVDDERVIANTFALILNRNGFEARAAYSCREALQHASDFQPHILISDVLMTDFNGIDAAIQIRALIPEIQVFLFSGQSGAADLLDRPEASAHSFEMLEKPVHPRDLLSRLQAAIGLAPELAPS